MYEQITLTLEGLLHDALHLAYPEVVTEDVKVSMPTDKTKADFVSNISFRLSKQLGYPPFVVAETICNSFLTLTDDFKAGAVAPGFINFRLNDKTISSLLGHINNEKSNYGSNTLLRGQTWVVEHTSPNPNKAMHVGHLRNNLIGMTISNVLDFSGAKVIRDWVDNDRGIAIAKAMWGYLAYKQKSTDKLMGSNLIDSWFIAPQDWLLPSDLGMKADHFAGDCYTLGSSAFKENRLVEEETRKLALNWEQGDEKVWKLWRLILSFAHTGIFETLDRVGNKWDHAWHEHEHYQQGKELVQQGIEKGIFKRLEDGAVLTQLEVYKIPDTIVLKSDNTSLYITQDIALTKLKKETYEADKLLWVIGPEQSVAMKQVFAICEQLGIGLRDDFIHVPYGLISIAKDGVRKKMSSRGGEALLIDTLLDEVMESMLQTDRGYSAEDADRIAVAAVKFAMLKAARNTDTVIDISQAISLEGDSGVYVLYTAARIRALMSKMTAGLVSDTATRHEYNESEHAHAVKLLYFPQIIKATLSDYSPNSLVEYSLDIAHSFNSIYAKERFISDDASETLKKTELASATLILLETTLQLLGIQRIEKI